MISLDHANLTTTPESDATDLARYFWDFVLLKGQCPTLRQIPVTWPHKKMRKSVSSCVELKK